MLACFGAMTSLSPKRSPKASTSSLVSTSSLSIVQNLEPREFETDVRRVYSGRGIIGFRAWICILGFAPATLLNTLVPLFALLRGHVALPNIMLSDVMAVHSLYEAIYTWGFSMSMMCVCFILRESCIAWARQIPEMSVPIYRFMFVLYTMTCPSLLGLVAFQYKHDMVLSIENPFDMILDSDFLQWFLHAFHTSVFFLSACFMAHIYAWRINPELTRKGLVHPSDQFVRESCSRIIMLLLPIGVVARMFHLVFNNSFWGLILVIVEILLIQLLVTTGIFGGFRLMMKLDDIDPMVHREKAS